MNTTSQYILQRSKHTEHYIRQHSQHEEFCQKIPVSTLRDSAYGGVPPLPLSIPPRDNKITGRPLNNILAHKQKSPIPEAHRNYAPTHSSSRNHKTPALPPVHHTSQWESPVKGKQKGS